MLFPTVDFAIFFALVFLGHWLLNPKPLPWKLFMIGASYVFYAWWDVHFVWLLAGDPTLSQLGAMAVARQQEERAQRWTMAIAVDADAAAARLLQVLRVLLAQPHRTRPTRSGSAPSCR